MFVQMISGQNYESGTKLWIRDKTVNQGQNYESGTKLWIRDKTVNQGQNYESGTKLWITDKTVNHGQNCESRTKLWITDKLHCKYSFLVPLQMVMIVIYRTSLGQKDWISRYIHDKYQYYTGLVWDRSEALVMYISPVSLNQTSERGNEEEWSLSTSDVLRKLWVRRVLNRQRGQIENLGGGGE